MSIFGKLHYIIVGKLFL